VVAAEAQEIDLYVRHRAFVSYGFYLARSAAHGADHDLHVAPQLDLVSV
jgi:hypothetical protein